MTKLYCGAVALLGFILIANGCELRVERTFEHDSASDVFATTGLIVSIEVRR